MVSLSQIPMKVDRFSIRPGMTGNEVIQEIRGKVAGESTPRLRDLFGSIEDYDSGTFRSQVASVDNKNNYAYLKRISKSYPSIDPVMRNLDFLVGINDEGYYFVHQLNLLPLEYRGDIDRTVKWVNKYDEGFTDRVQGDLLIKFVYLNLKLPSERAVIITPESVGIKRLEDRVYQDDIHIENELAFYTMYDKENNFYNIRVFDSTLSKPEEYYMDSWDTHDTPLKLGEHSIRTDVDWKGRARMIPFTNRNGDQPPYVFITGKAFDITHPEHGMKHVVIPPMCMAIITTQRGSHVNVEDYWWRRSSMGLQTSAMSGGDD